LFFNKLDIRSKFQDIQNNIIRFTSYINQLGQLCLPYQLLTFFENLLNIIEMEKPLKNNERFLFMSYYVVNMNTLNLSNILNYIKCFYLTMDKKEK
jgi:hypothetical protein